MTSSTSSSERFRVPWGAVWAVAFFALVELGFRMLPASFFLTFDQNDYGDRETLDYDAVGLAVELLEPPDVAVLGTSRAREGVPAPRLASRLEAALGRPVEVRNDGIAAGRIDISLAVLERMIAEGHVPHVLVLAIDGSDLRDQAPHPERARMVTLATLPDQMRRDGSLSETELTHVLGNSIGLRMADARETLRYRWIRRGSQTAEAFEAMNPSLGGMSQWNRDFLAEFGDLADDDLPDGRLDPDRVRMTIRGYVIAPRAVERLHAFLDLAAAHGVQVVLAEIPASSPVRRKKVSRVISQLRVELGADDERPCVHVWMASAIDVDGEFPARFYRDPSHLNAAGGTHFVELIAPTVAKALAAGSCSDP